MTMMPVQLPLKGFTEQNSYSSVPQGMTPSCLNVLPSDVYNGRIRIGTRQGTKRWYDQNVQFLGVYRLYLNGTFTENLIMVREGKVYYGSAQSATPSWTLFGDQATAKLSTTASVISGIQFNEHFFFVDGTNYVVVHLDSPTGSGTDQGVKYWGSSSSPKSGPYQCDPVGVTNGDRATLICRWGARVVISGFRTIPTVWFACGADKPFGKSTSTDGWDANNGFVSALAGGTGGEGYGTVGDPIVAMFPFGQTGLMFGCTNSFEYLTSDPDFDSSAQMVRLTKSVGIAGRNAWCQGQEKSAYVLGSDGLYLLLPNDFNFNRGNRISAGRLDSFFLRLDLGAPPSGGSGVFSGGTLRSSGSGSGSKAVILDPSKNIDPNPTVDDISAISTAESLIGSMSNGDIFPSLCWDEDREGVWIFLTVSGAEQQSVHLYYDAKTDSFWPQRFADPNMYGPTGSIYISPSRSKLGKLFMYGNNGISVIDRGFPIGIDGYTNSLTDVQRRSQLIKNNLTVGPIIAPLPQRVMLQEVRVDLGEDEYEVPTSETDVSVPPVLTVGIGDTAQAAIGLKSDTVFVTQFNELILDGEDHSVPASFITYDGGTHVAPTPDVVNGGRALSPFGLYSKANPFTSGTTVEYNGPLDYVLKVSSSLWKIGWQDESGFVVEYEKSNGDLSTPNGPYVNVIDDPVAPDTADRIDVSGASFDTSEVIEIAQLQNGRNEAIKARIRSECMYMTIASDGRPWSVERMSVLVSQVGKSRGAP